ncbi:hypothetical protein Lal_00047610 [Lupinus albus]|nr:hypothetical protein Lal_00047610 [Lupinus albus]
MGVQSPIPLYGPCPQQAIFDDTNPVSPKKKMLKANSPFILTKQKVNLAKTVSYRPIQTRAGLFYPGDGVVDSLLAPRGSTTKRLKESDLVVTQPRAGLFYPGDGVVDSLLAPRGSTTKRLKESDLVVTQPVKIISSMSQSPFALLNANSAGTHPIGPVPVTRTLRAPK